MNEFIFIEKIILYMQGILICLRGDFRLLSSDFKAEKLSILVNFYCFPNEIHKCAKLNYV